MTINVPTLIQSKTKVKYLCVLMFLSFPLSMGEVPGPCRHSITREHLLTLRHLMDNQLRSGCSITYTFIERRGLSKCCFVKASLPWILELLTTHFRYTRGSISDGYVQSLRALIHNIYSQRCVPQINEEVEDKPESFEVIFRGSPTEALQKAQEVLSVYWELVTLSDTPLDWTCQGEYSETFPTETFTDIPTDPPTERAATDRAERKSVRASQMSPGRERYKFGFIITSVCGALLLMFTVYCLVIQKKTQTHHTSRSSVNWRPHPTQDIEMEVQ